MSIEVHVGSYVGDKLRAAQDRVTKVAQSAQDAACRGAINKNADEAVLAAATPRDDGRKEITLDELMRMRETAKSLGCTAAIRRRYDELIRTAKMNNAENSQRDLL